MTVYYTPSVSTAKFIDFVRVLIRWRGSVWKLILPELCIWLIAYSILNLVYRLALTEDQKRLENFLSFSLVHTVSYS